MSSIKHFHAPIMKMVERSLGMHGFQLGYDLKWPTSQILCHQLHTIVDNEKLFKVSNTVSFGVQLLKSIS